MSSRGKNPLCHTETEKVQKSMHIYAVWSGHSLLTDIYYRLQWFYWQTMTAQISLHKCAGWSGPALSINCTRDLFVSWISYRNMPGLCQVYLITFASSQHAWCDHRSSHEFLSSVPMTSTMDHGFHHLAWHYHDARIKLLTWNKHQKSENCAVYLFLLWKLLHIFVLSQWSNCRWPQILGLQITKKKKKKKMRAYHISAVPINKF